MTPNRYLDHQNQIEYVFLNFSKIQTESEMKELVAKHGTLRRTPFGQKKFKNGPLEVTIDWGMNWEFKAITRSGPTPEEILVYDLGCRMIATD